MVRNDPFFHFLTHIYIYIYIYIYIQIFTQKIIFEFIRNTRTILIFVSVKLKSRSENLENNRSLPFLTQSGPNFWLESPHKWIFLKQI